MSERRWLLAIMGGLLLVNLLAYVQIARHDFVSYDTDLYVYANPHLKDGFSLAGVAWAFDPRHAYAGNWHPLTWLSHMLDCQLFGVERPGAHLLVNLALHVASSWLLLLVLVRMTRALWPSALVAALFAIHPLHVESVAWVAERKDVLSGLFWMLTLGAYAWYAERPSWRRMALVAAALAAGLMSKPMSVTLPCVLLLLDAWPLGRASFDLSAASLRRWGVLVLEKLPLFVLVAGASAMTYIVQKQAGAVNLSLTFGQRLVGGVWAYGMYLVKTFWPVNLACFYPRPDTQTFNSSGYRTEVLILLAGLAAVTLLALAQRKKRPYLLVGWLWYLGTLVPVIGIFVQVGEQSMADRYTYIPQIGVCLMLAWGLADLAAAWPAWSRRALAISGLAVVMILTGLTWLQARAWRNSETLYRHATLVTENNAFAHSSLGVELRRNGDLPGALEQCEKAVALDPADWNNQQNLALVLIDLGRLDEAEAHAQRAAELYPPAAAPLTALGFIFARRQQYAPALDAYEAALKREPGGAAAELREQTLNLIARDTEQLWQQNQIDQALANYRLIVQHAPERHGAANNLAWLLATHGKGVSDAAEAVALAERANRGTGGREPDVVDTLSLAYAAAGRFADAATTAEAALKLAQEKGNAPLLKSLPARIEAYRAGRAPRE